jgi:hypothetical protein
VLGSQDGSYFSSARLGGAACYTTPPTFHHHISIIALTEHPLRQHLSKTLSLFLIVYFDSLSEISPRYSTVQSYFASSAESAPIYEAENRMTVDGKYSAENFMSEKDILHISGIGDSSPSWQAREEWPNGIGVSTTYLKRYDNLLQFQSPLVEHDAIELRVIGQVPSYVAGVLYRTGPYAYQVGDTPTGTYSRSHWFDGFSQTHRFQIIPTSAGAVRILYSSRSQVGGLVEKIRETGDFHTYTFALKREPCQGILGKLFSVFTPIEAVRPEPACPDSASIPVCIRSILRKGAEKNGTALILETDFSMTKELDYETLEPIGIANQLSLHHLLKGPLSCVYAMTDRDTGDVFNYNLDFGRYATYRVLWKKMS